MTNLSNLEPLPPEDWHSDLSRVISDMGGRPLNVHRLMAHNPALLDAWWPFRKHCVNGGGLDNRHRELIVLRVAAHMRSWYEWASHVERGLAAGLTRAEIERVSRATDDADWAQDDALVLRTVDDCIAHRRIRRETLLALHERFSASQVLDMIAVQGMYAMLGVMINTWEIELDEAVELSPETNEETWLRTIRPCPAPGR